MDHPEWNDEELLRACQSPIHPDAVKGIELFNHTGYFEAHEALETAWRDEPGAQRDLYRAILLAAVTLLHMQRGNFEGALKVSQRCLRWIAPFGEICCGVQVGALRRQVLVINQRLEVEGADFLRHFNFTGVNPIIFDQRYPLTFSEKPKGIKKSSPKE
jgi:hypothetical protein